VRIELEINGERHAADVEPRTLLSDFIRHHAGLTGTKVGCEHGVCGACTVQLDGEPARSCLMLAVQANGRSLRTIDALGAEHPLARAFHEHHALQCGFCTPGMVMSVRQLLKDQPDPSEHEIRHGLAGNICRCTGYHNIVRAVESLASKGDQP
jgi:aerobic carbon-monoxide dehydrogenase small subunit